MMGEMTHRGSGVLITPQGLAVSRIWAKCVTVVAWEITDSSVDRVGLSVKMMPTQFKFSQNSVDDLFAQIWQSGYVSLHARHVLRTLLLEEDYTQDEQATIDRLLYAVRRGWLKVQS